MSCEEMNPPQLLVFAGPNGSGKSTITKTIKPVGLYINADDIKKMYDYTDLDAAQIAEKMRNKLVEELKSFTFETVLSTDRNMKLLAQAKAAGYRIQIIFILTNNSLINVDRVRKRVLSGGHAVPEDKVISRYKRSLKNIPALTRLADRLIIFDNTGDKPVIMCEVISGIATIAESQHWTKKGIFNLLAGTESPE